MNSEVVDEGYALLKLTSAVLDFIEVLEAHTLSPLDAAVEYGPDWEPPSEQDVNKAYALLRSLVMR